MNTTNAHHASHHHCILCAILGSIALTGCYNGPPPQTVYVAPSPAVVVAGPPVVYAPGPPVVVVAPGPRPAYIAPRPVYVRNRNYYHH